MIRLPAVPGAAPTLRWNIPLGTGGEFDVADEVVAIAEPVGSGVTVRRLDLASGTPVWSVDVAGAGAGASIEVDVTGPPGAAVVAVLARAATPDGTPGATRLSVLDAADGRVLHTAESDGSLFVDATADLVVAGSPVAGTVAVDRATGQVRWQTPESVEVSDSRLIIESITGLADAVGLPADAADDWTGGETNGAVQVLDPASGSPVWEMARPFFSETSVVGDLLVLTEDRSGESDTVTGYEAATGAQRWQSPNVRTVGRPDVAWLGADAVLVQNGEPYGPAKALDRATGALRWTTPASVEMVLSIGGEPVVVAFDDSSLASEMTLLGANGAPTATSALQVAGTGSVAPADGALYAVAGDAVVALGLPTLAERWRVPAAIEENGLPAAVESGFVSRVGDEVRAYVS